jgi:hypothetical protein
MSGLTVLASVELLPVIELTPGAFSTRERTLPSASGRDLPDEWHRYWLDSLRDSGVVGLIPLWPWSWLVATRQLTDAGVLNAILSTIVRGWGGPEVFSDPDSKPVLDGGLALCCGSEVLIEPTCCGDLGNLSEWREAATYRQPDWKMLWVGHPWVSVWFHEGRLGFSEPHESDSPVARWAVRPEELGQAIAAAEAELEDFACRLRPALDAMGVAEAPRNARRLAGLET